MKQQQKVGTLGVYLSSPQMKTEKFDDGASYPPPDVLMEFSAGKMAYVAHRPFVNE